MEERRAGSLAMRVLSDDGKPASVFIKHFLYVERINIPRVRYLVVRGDNWFTSNKPLYLKS